MCCRLSKSNRRFFPGRTRHVLRGRGGPKKVGSSTTELATVFKWAGGVNPLGTDHSCLLASGPDNGTWHSICLPRLPKYLSAPLKAEPWYCFSGLEIHRPTQESIP